MENEFLPYELAVKLKELGFDEPCLGFYNHQGQLILMAQEDESSIEMYKNSYVEMGMQYAAPLFQQVFRWFREEHGIFSWLTRHRYNITTSLGNKEYYRWALEYEVEKSEPHINSEIVYSDKEYDTYEEVELACLTKLIEIAEGNGKEEML